MLQNIHYWCGYSSWTPVRRIWAINSTAGNQISYFTFDYLNMTSWQAGASAPGADWLNNWTTDCADNRRQKKMVQQLALVELTKKHTFPPLTSEPWVSLWILTRSCRYLTVLGLFSPFFLKFIFQISTWQENRDRTDPKAWSVQRLLSTGTCCWSDSLFAWSVNQSISHCSRICIRRPTTTNMELLKQTQGLVWDWDLKTTLIRRGPGL